MGKKIMGILLWSLVLVCMVSIFMLSHQPAIRSSKLSKEVTSQVIDVVARVTDTPIENKVNLINQMNHYVRKMAHATIYFTLTILCFLAFQTMDANKIPRNFWTSIGICLFYAISDEMHQYFVVGRGAQVRDVCIDLIGGLIGGLLILFLTLVWKRLINFK